MYVANLKRLVGAEIGIIRLPSIGRPAGSSSCRVEPKSRNT